MKTVVPFSSTPSFSSSVSAYFTISFKKCIVDLCDMGRGLYLIRLLHDAIVGVVLIPVGSRRRRRRIWMMRMWRERQPRALPLPHLLTLVHVHCRRSIIHVQEHCMAVLEGLVFVVRRLGFSLCAILPPLSYFFSKGHSTTKCLLDTRL